MRRFTQLYRELDATSSTAAKTAALVEYFRDAPPDDAAWAVALFVGKRPKGTASSRVVTELAVEIARVPRWLLDECRSAVGELAETVALLLPVDQPTGGVQESLAEVIRTRVQPLAVADDRRRVRIVAAALGELPAEQRFVYLKLIRGGFRVGVQRRMLARSLATIAGVDPAVVEHRLAGGFVPSAASYLAIVSGQSAADDAARPFPFFLASQLEGEPEALGDRSNWLAEWKWDGVRAQLIRRGDPVLWSRGDEIMTHQFPEITSAARSLPTGTVLDGEVLLWSSGAPLPFAALQRRLNRSSPPPPQLPLFASRAPVFMAFDLLEHEGRDIRDRTAHERRAMLESVIGAASAEAIMLSPLVDASGWAELAAARSTSRERGVEGLMLKHADSVYAVGRVKPAGSHGWWKWKVDPYTVDAVLVYAYPGTGRRATLFTDYAFAVWGERDGERVLMPFTRAYSGLGQGEIEALDAWIRRHTRRTMGPAREVEPERVFEIGFEGIAESSRHRAGLAVRFPRILRERRDKQAADADTIEALRQLLRAADPEQP